MKKVALKWIRFFPSRVNFFSEGMQSIFERVTSLESVSVPLKKGFATCFIHFLIFPIAMLYFQALINHLRVHSHASVYSPTMSAILAQQILTSMRIIMGKDGTKEGKITIITPSIWTDRSEQTV